MRVLFDHNLPHKLRTSLGTLGKHEIVTASYMGWGDFKNGELLRRAEESGFEVLVTGDQSLLYEQNLSGRRLAIVALSANNWPIVKGHIPQILDAIDSAVPGSFRTVECGTSAGRKGPARIGSVTGSDRRNILPTYSELHHLPRLQSAQRVWRLSSASVPPWATGTLWSTCNSRPARLHMQQR